MNDMSKKSSVEFIGGGQYCRLAPHHKEAKDIVSESGGRFIGGARPMWKISNDGDLHARITDAARRDDLKRMAGREIMDAEAAGRLKVGENHDFGGEIGVKPVLWVSRAFEGKDRTFDARFSELGLAGKQVAYVYHEDPPKEALRNKPRERTPAEQRQINDAAAQRAASREIVEVGRLAGVEMGKPFDFGGDIGKKPVLWISAAFEAAEAKHDPRFSDRGLVGKQVAYVYHDNPPMKALEAAAAKGGPAAEALRIVMSKAEAPKAETPKAEAPKAEAPKAETPKAEEPKAEAPKAGVVSAATVAESGMLGDDDFAALGDLSALLDEAPKPAPVEDEDSFSDLESLGGDMSNLGGL